MNERAPVLGAVAALGVAAFLARDKIACLLARLLAVPAPPANDVTELIGSTPLVRIGSLSRLTGCTIYGKLELANPGGSAKDRVALAVVDAAERSGALRPGHRDRVYEGTSGSTGISLAMICNARGYEAHIVLPDDTSPEKVALLKAMGAVVHAVRPAAIADAGHYVNQARRLAAETNKNLHDVQAVFVDQFENEENWRCHYDTTGPEIWQQVRGRIDAFVAGSGTGGTIAGVGRYLRERKSSVRIVLADPQGSGLRNRIVAGVMFNPTEREGMRRRHQVDTIVEGIGSNRLTNNIAHALPYITDAETVTDDEALVMAHHLVEHDGLFVGSSSGVACVAAYRVAKQLGPGHTIVTILCDTGARYISKFWTHKIESNTQFARELAG